MNSALCSPCCELDPGHKRDVTCRSAQRPTQLPLRLAQELDTPSPQGYAFTCLGHALAGLEKLAEAGEAYQQALNIRQELNQPRLALEALSGLARVSLAQGDRIQAQAHADQVLSSLEIHNLDGTQEPFRIYLTCYRVLRASEDPRADKILATARGLLQERAAKIENEDLSCSFLENVAAHREIVEEYSKLH